MEVTFTKIYKSKLGDSPGSSVKYNRRYIDFIEDFIYHNSIFSILDAGCGDWTFSRTVDWGIARYMGIDCVREVINNNHEYSTPFIEFEHIDFYHNREVFNRKFDLIILKDVLQHWETNQIEDFLDDIVKRGNFKFILLVNSYQQSQLHDRNINNRYKYDKLDASLTPLRKYNPKILFYYQYKQISLIENGSMSGATARMR